MGSEPPGVDFALLGHQESWAAISSLVHTLRDPQRGRLSVETLRETIPWIPPRAIGRLSASSLPGGRTVRGTYIETFITPDELQPRCYHQNVEKVRAAVRCAEREGARVAALGGFTSIVLEGRPLADEDGECLALTTGNTLAAALIVKGVEQAAEILCMDLSESKVLIVGATGDIGKGCTRYLASRVGKLFLAARNESQLARLQASLSKQGIQVVVTTDAQGLIPKADVVICTASLSAPQLDIGGCHADALVCDAGYPKNVKPVGPDQTFPRVFWGGLGQLLGGWRSDSNLIEAFYRFPVPGVVHGCLLEGVLLALEERYESFSSGRGRITPARIEEVWDRAARQGIVVAPFFNEKGLWPLQARSRQLEEGRLPDLTDAGPPRAGRG